MPSLTIEDFMVEHCPEGQSVVCFIEICSYSLAASGSVIGITRVSASGVTVTQFQWN